LGGGHSRRCGQARSEGIKEYLREMWERRAVGLDRPDAAQNRILDYETRRLRWTLGKRDRWSEDGNE